MTVVDQVGSLLQTYETGLFTNRTNDRGGPTRWGVTIPVLQTYRRRKTGDVTLVVTEQDIRNLSFGEAVDCVVHEIAVTSNIILIPDDGLRLAVLDYAIHSGPVRAIQALQVALNVTPDGVLGPLTQHALTTESSFAAAMFVCTARHKFLQGLILKDATQRENMLGWWTRVTEITTRVLQLHYSQV